MFKFLKDKVKSVISAISKKVEESAPEPTVIEKIEQAMQEPVKEIHPDSVPEPTPELIREKQVKEVLQKVEKKKEVEVLIKRIRKLSEEQIDLLFEQIGWIDAEEGTNKALPNSKLKEIKGNYEFAYRFIETVIQESDLEEIERELAAIESESKAEIKIKEVLAPITPVIVEEKKVIEEVKVEQIQEQKSSFFSKLKDKFTKKEEEQVKEEIKLIEEEAKETPLPIKEEKKTFFQSVTQKITSKKISDKEFEELFWELEVGLLESSVALEVVEKIKSDLKLRL